jgi:arylsulfatase A-like enzyme
MSHSSTFGIIKMIKYLRKQLMCSLKNSSYRILIRFLLMGIFVAYHPAMTCGQGYQAQKKSNILFVLVDDMSWNGVSSFGNPHVSTPNIDRLAKEGMKFNQAYVAPVCTPTRGEFLSGEYGARTGITQVLTHRIYPNAPLLTPKPVDKLPENTYTITNMLQNAGYATAISGKWHIGDAYRTANLKKKYGDRYFAPYGFDYVGDAVVKAWDKVDKDKAAMDITRNVLQFIR